MRKLFFVNFQNTPLFFLLCFVQRLGNLLRDALPFFLILRPRISFQRGVPQVCGLTGPHLELALVIRPLLIRAKYFLYARW